MNGSNKDCIVLTIYLSDKRLQELAPLSTLELNVWVIKNLSSMIKKENIVSITLVKDPKTPSINILYKT